MSKSTIARRSLLAAGGAAFAAAAAGCGNSGSTNTSSAGTDSEIGDDPDKVEGTISYGFWDVNQEKMLKDIIAAFNKQYPNVTVNLQMTPWKDYFTKLRTQVSSKALPDVFWLSGPQFHAYADNGHLATLQGLVDADLFDPNNYPSPLMNMYSVDGEPFAAPKDFDTVAIWYNKKLFDQAGVDYPDETWTLDIYKEKALELGDKLPDDVFGCAEVFSRTASYYHSIPICGGHVISEDKKTSGYDDPSTIQGVQFWRDLIESGASPDMDYLAENSAYALFESGKCAMQWSGNWRVPAMLEASTKDEVTVAPLPGGDDRKTAIHGIGNAISAHTKNMAASQAFVVFLAGEEAAQISAESGAANPALNGTQDAYVQAHPELNLQVFIDQAENNAVEFPVSKSAPEWQELEGEYLTKVFTGELTAEEGCTQLAEAMNDVLAKENE